MHTPTSYFPDLPASLTSPPRSSTTVASVDKTSSQQAGNANIHPGLSNTIVSTAVLLSSHSNAPACVQQHSLPPRVAPRHYPPPACSTVHAYGLAPANTLVQPAAAAGCPWRCHLLPNAGSRLLVVEAPPHAHHRTRQGAGRVAVRVRVLLRVACARGRAGGS